MQALSEITPVRSGKTASSWYYEIERKNGAAIVAFNNSNIVEGQSIAILIQEGHGTGTGGYVPGYNYIDPALKPYLDELLNKVWKEVTSK